MATNSTNKNLYRPDPNTYQNTWDVPLNTNWTGLDYALGGVTYISVTGQSGTKTMSGSYDVSYPYPPLNIGSSGSPVTTSPSYIPYDIIITGILTANMVYQIPAGTCGQWSVYNNTTGSYTVSFQVGSGTTYAIDQGKRRLIVSDGVTISRADSPSDAQGSSTSLQFNDSGTFGGSALRYTANTGNFTVGPLSFTGAIDSSGNLTTTGSQPLSAGMVIKKTDGTTIMGTVVSGSGTSFVLSSYTPTLAITLYAYPSSVNADISLTVNGYDNKYSALINGGKTSAQSFGLKIVAGSTAADYSVLVQDKDATDLFNIDGLGSANFVSKSASTKATVKITGKNTATPSITPTVPPALDVRGGAYTLSYLAPFNSGAITIDCSLSNVFYTTLTGSVGSAPTFSNPSQGQTVNWFISQDATGGRTMTWPTSFKWPNGVTSYALSTAGSKTDLLVGTYLGTVWYVTLVNGYSSTVPTT